LRLVDFSKCEIKTYFGTEGELIKFDDKITEQVGRVTQPHNC